MTKPLELTSDDQEVLEILAENGPRFHNSLDLPSKVLTVLARQILLIQQSLKPRSVPITERAMDVQIWKEAEKLNDRDFLVWLAMKGHSGSYYDFRLFMKKFAPIIARSLLTNTVAVQDYHDEKPIESLPPTKKARRW